MDNRTFTSPGYLHRDPRIERAGNAAIGLWTRAGQWAAVTQQHVIPTMVVLELGTAPQADRLVKAGLWDEVDGGYVFRSIPGIKAGHGVVSDDHRAKAAERARRYRARKREQATPHTGV